MLVESTFWTGHSGTRLYKLSTEETDAGGAQFQAQPRKFSNLARACLNNTKRARDVV